MKIKDYKCKCGSNDFFFMDKCNHKGIYCTDCGRWLKWADKDEQNLAMKQEPKTDIALDRYRDLQDYFSDEAVAKTILENQTEFKSWLKRLKWNTKKVDELARKLEALEQKSILDKIRAEIANHCGVNTDYCDSCRFCTDSMEVREILQIIDKYKIESEEI